MAEKAIERYDTGLNRDAGGQYFADVIPVADGWLMRYDAELVRDAMRYRWLREHGSVAGVIDWRALGVGYQQLAEMDAAIDTAISHSGRVQR